MSWTWHSVTPLRAARAAIRAMSPTGTGQELKWRRSVRRRGMPAEGYCRGKRDVEGIGRTQKQLDRGEVAGVGRIRQPSHLGAPTNGGESNYAVVQRRTAAQDQIPPVGIGVGQLPGGVGVEMQAV